MADPIPDDIAQKIAQRAVTIAAARAPKRSGKGASNLMPSYGAGNVGITVPKEYG